jgi:hypothetical protein
VTIAYSANLDRLLAAIARMRDGAPNLKIANDTLALLAQLRISEVSGLERATGAAALANGGFAPDRFLALSRITMRESALLNGLALWVSPDILIAIDKALVTPEARDFAARRTALLSAQGVIPEQFVNVRTWIALASARIRTLTAAENHTIAEIMDELGAAHDAAHDAAQTGARRGMAMATTLGALMASGGAAKPVSAALGLGGSHGRAEFGESSANRRR